MSALERLFRREHEFPVAGLGVVRIRNLSEADRVELFDGTEGEDGLLNRRIVARCLVAIDGEPVSLTPEQVAEIDWQFHRLIANQIYDHCRLGEDQPGNSPPANDTSGG